MGEAGQARQQTGFSIEATARRIEQLYEEFVLPSGARAER